LLLRRNLQKKIDKTTYVVEVHFSDTSTQSVADKLKRVILHDLEHGKQSRSRNKAASFGKMPQIEPVSRD